MNKINIAIISIIISACAVSLRAQTIENELLKVELKDQGISITSKPSGVLFVPKMNFSSRIAKSRMNTSRHDKWGEGNVLELTHENGWITTLTIYPNSPFIQVHTTVTNNGVEAVIYNQFDFLSLQADCGVSLDKAKVLGTGGLTPVSGAKGSYAFSVLADPDTRRSVVCGWLTHEQGTGIFFPKAADGKAVIDAKVDFGRMRVNPGKTRGTETLLIGYFADGRLGLEAYADAVVKHYNIKLRPRPNVYCTWYHSRASSEKAITANTTFAEKNLQPFGLNVMQIDDGWQAPLPKGFKHKGRFKKTGPWKCFVDSQGNYPEGMAHTAEMIQSHGMVAGIWFMPWAGNLNNPYFDKAIFVQNPDGTPFHDGRWSGTCIDSTSPKGEAFIRQRIKRIYDWGYRYFKIDGMHTGLATYNIYVNTFYKEKDFEAFGKVKLYDPDKTQVQAYRKCLKIAQEEAPEALVLGCNVSQNMRSMGPAFDMIDAMRIGPDNGKASRGDWGNLSRGPWHGSNLYFLNGRVWYNDPDPVYVRKSNPIEKARWMCSWLAVSGGMHTSSERYDKLQPERLDMLKRCLPGHDCEARPVDYLETNQPRIWLASNDRMSVIGLFNWAEKEKATIEYDMGKLGLDKSKTYVGFDFWAKTFIAPFSGTLKQTLSGGTCRIIAVQELTEHPVLVSTSRHITQGLVDVIEAKWDAATKTFSGKSKVVAGDLYELRIALPASGTFLPTSAKCGDNNMKIGEVTNGGVKISITPEKSETVKWRMTF